MQTYNGSIDQKYRRFNGYNTSASFNIVVWYVYGNLCCYG